MRLKPSVRGGRAAGAGDGLCQGVGLRISSSVDRASHYGCEGRRFESCEIYGGASGDDTRLHTGTERPTSVIRVAALPMQDLCADEGHVPRIFQEGPDAGTVKSEQVSREVVRIHHPPRSPGAKPTTVTSFLFQRNPNTPSGTLISGDTDIHRNSRCEQEG